MNTKKINLQLKRLVRILFLMLFTNACSANSTVFNKVTDLNYIKEQLLKDDATETSTLLVFDIDDTLLESINFVGSTKWYNWQRGKVVKNINGQSFTIDKKNQFSCIFRALGTMFELGSTKLTQKDAATIIKQFKNYDLMLLTARTTIYRDATERELKKNGIDLSDKHLMEKNSHLHLDFNDGNRTAKVTYQNGIAMLSGLNKGLVLKELLEKMGKTYKHIYFVDDSEKNVAHMQTEWKNDQTKMTIFHYTKVNQSISQEEIEQSVMAKQQFDSFLHTAYPDRFKNFQNSQCE